MTMQATSVATVSQNPRSTAKGLLHLSAAQLDDIAVEFDAIRARLIRERGARDATYIRRLILVQRGLEVVGRGALAFGFFPPTWVLGVAALSVSKILDNMEIGHNIIHGQYDFMNDPALRSQTFEWDVVTPADQWRHSHNYIHHTFTNIVGKDRDVGYGVLRMTDTQAWTPGDLANPLKAVALASLFEVGIAFHDLEIEKISSGEKKWSDVTPQLKGIGKKIGAQFLKDYVLFPLLAFWAWPAVLLGNSAANFIRNVWAFVIIFCGHFPDDVALFTEEETKNESRGGWYVRQLLGSANIKGGKLFHIMSGNLSHQIEHHLFPDMPAHRYADVAPGVQDICRRYGLPYNTGGLTRQFTNVAKKIVRLSLPNSGRRAPSIEAATTV